MTRSCGSGLGMGARRTFPDDKSWKRRRGERRREGTPHAECSHRRPGTRRAAPGPGRAGTRGCPADAGRCLGGRGRRLSRRSCGRAGRGWPAAGGRQRPRSPAGGHDRGWLGRGARAADQRPPGGSGERRAVPVPVGDLAALVPQVSEGGRGAAAAVPARAVHRRLRPRARGVLRLRGGLSAAGVGRLLAAWQADYQAFTRRDLTDRDEVDLWADGVHFGVWLEQARLCCLVMVGVRADGTKELVAVADGERESTESWAELLRDLRCRGMRAPVVAVGDGALGLWAALRDIFPATRQQRDWVHKLASVLGCLPKAVHAGARKALAEVRDAPDRDHAERAVEVFARDYGVKWAKAVAKITDDAEELLCFFDFPAEHWVHLTTSNPIESTFASVRLRTRVTKGPGSKAAGLAMAFKLLEAAQDRWRAVNGPRLVALVRAGARFDKGVLIERPNDVEEVAA